MKVNLNGYDLSPGPPLFIFNCCFGEPAIMAAGEFTFPGSCSPESLANSVFDFSCLRIKKKLLLKLSTTDLLVLASMKNAAKCDK